MKVSGFTFIKNAIKYDYPVVEAITSVLPMVDEFIVCLGNSEDATNDLIASIGSDKIKLIHSVWDNSLREGGKVLAVETDKALQATAADSDWLFYIQADEVVHEKYHANIIKAMQQYKDDKKVDGLLFNYTHFYGSYKYIGDGRSWYSGEIRIIRNNKHIHSYKDAQGFRFDDNSKLKVKPANASIYHYGWVKNPLTMFNKAITMHKMYVPDNVVDKMRANFTVEENKYDFTRVETVSLFNGTHPVVMKDRILTENWSIDIDEKRKKFKNLKHKVLYFLNKKFGWRPFEYRNYIKI